MSNTLLSNVVTLIKQENYEKQTNKGGSVAKAVYLQTQGY